jgi:hypothetical protein
MEIVVHRVETHPTSSLRQRAARLAEAVRMHAGNDDAPIHLIAHSSGGLDARLMLTPGASLPTAFDIEPLAGRVRSLVTIATPHLGTPLATFFNGMFGQQVLQLLSLSMVHALRFGRAPWRAVSRLALVLRPSRTKAETGAAIADVRETLLENVDAENRGALDRMIAQMGDDQALVPQLSPEGLDVFNAATNDRPGVRYGCVVTRAARPTIVAALRIGMSRQSKATYALFRALYRLTARMPQRRSKWFSEARAEELARTFGEPVLWTDSDGVVPTRSQVWGELVGGFVADHLDVIGHFHDGRDTPEHFDWFASGSGFDRAAFEQLWGDVIRFADGAEARAIALRDPLADARRFVPSRWTRVGIAAAGLTVAFAAYEALRPALLESWGAFAWMFFVLSAVAGLVPLWLVEQRSR